MVWLVCMAAMATAVAIGSMTRGIMHYGNGTDGEKQTRTAARSAQWRWPSDMHRDAQGKAWMKDVGVLGVALMQRLLKDFQGPAPLIWLALVAQTISAALVFVVAQAYWNAPVALFLFVLYLTCCWPYQIVLLGGFQGLAQMLLLGAVACLQQASLGGPASVVWHVGAGILIGGLLFASASSRKFLPLAMGAFLWSQRGVIAPVGVTPGGWASLTHGMGLALVILIGILGLGCALVGARFTTPLYQRFVTAVYCQRAPRWLNGLIKARDQFPLEHYLKKQATAIRAVRRLSVGMLGYLVACAALSRAPSFYLTQGLVAFGACSAALFFTYPEVIWNVKGYLGYWNIAPIYHHFSLYTEQFAKAGRRITSHTPGGWRWFVRFFRRTLPFHSLLYVWAIGAALSSLFLSGLQPREVFSALSLIGLSLSPIVFGHLSGSPQVSRTYFPALLGLLLGIGCGAFRADQAFPPTVRIIWWSVAACLTVASVGWSAWVVLDDLWPGRMAATWLRDTLQMKGIRAFYTYETPGHNSLIRVWPARVRQQFDIRALTALKEVEEGYIVVPDSSAKSFGTGDARELIEHGDFSSDAELTHLLESREIERYAIASFKTLGSSRMWVHEHDVLSYRDLMLREVNERDRWRARAWILDAKKLAQARAIREAAQGSPAAIGG